MPAGAASASYHASVPAKLFGGLLFSLLTALLLVTASQTGWLPDAPDRFTYDWRTYLLTEKADKPRGDIAIVLIDEDSLKGYPYLSPIDRGLTAELIRQIDAAHPMAIGLDFIIDRPTEPAKDDALAAAIREAHAPIVLGAIDERAGAGPQSLAWQENFIARVRRPAGHLFFATEQDRLTLGDQAVRFMVPPSTGPRPRPAFARLLADIDGKKAEPESPYIYWRLPPGRGGADLFATFTVPAHRDDAGKRTGAILPEAWRSALRDKIVLVGGAFTDRDRHLTPLTVANGERISGVKVHAQILAQLRDGRSIYIMEPWAEFLLVALVIGFGFFAAQYWTLTGDGWLTSVVAFGAMIVGGLLLFWAFKFILPSATLFLAWPIGLFAGNRADAAAHRLKRLWAPRPREA
jgi:adenylate cyclase